MEDCNKKGRQLNDKNWKRWLLEKDQFCTQNWSKQLRASKKDFVLGIHLVLVCWIRFAFLGLSEQVVKRWLQKCITFSASKSFVVRLYCEAISMRHKARKQEEKVICFGT